MCYSASYRGPTCSCWPDAVRPSQLATATRLGRTRSQTSALTPLVSTMRASSTLYSSKHLNRCRITPSPEGIYTRLQAGRSSATTVLCSAQSCRTPAVRAALLPHRYVLCVFTSLPCPRWAHRILQVLRNCASYNPHNSSAQGASTALPSGPTSPPLPNPTSIPPINYMSS